MFGFPAIFSRTISDYSNPPLFFNRANLRRDFGSGWSGALLRTAASLTAGASENRLSAEIADIAVGDSAMTVINGGPGQRRCRFHDDSGLLSRAEAGEDFAQQFFVAERARHFR